MADLKIIAGNRSKNQAQASPGQPHRVQDEKGKNLEDQGKDSPFASVPQISEALKAGKAVVMVDDEDRENEGDVIVAAEHVTPDHINFMATHARGLICLAITEERCQRLALGMQIKEGVAEISTNFTVPIEAAQGIGTGISAADRAHTIKVAVAPDAKPDDLIQPGHIFPVRAAKGGVLQRAGHTEAATDLCRIAGLEPAGVICEVLKEDGAMARRDDLFQFAKEHGLLVGTIADLIQYRNLLESSVSEVQSTRAPTDFGPLELRVFRDEISQVHHTAFIHGNPKEASGAVPVRVHQLEPLLDLAGVKTGTVDRWSFSSSLEYMVQQEAGVLLLLGGVPRDPMQIFKSASQANQLASAGGKESGGDQSQVMRVIGVGSQILQKIGLKRIQLLGAPIRYASTSAFGLQIDEILPNPPSGLDQT